MRIIIIIETDTAQPTGRKTDLEAIGREIAREAGFQMRLLPAQYARIGRDFSNSVRYQIERWISGAYLESLN